MTAASWKTVVVIFGALLLRRVLDSGGVIIAASEALIAFRAPIPLVPFIISLFTGVIAAASGIGFLPVLSLIVADGGRLTWGRVAWMMAGGYLRADWKSPFGACGQWSAFADH